MEGVESVCCYVRRLYFITGLVWQDTGVDTESAWRKSLCTYMNCTSGTVNVLVQSVTHLLKCLVCHNYAI